MSWYMYLRTKFYVLSMFQFMNIMKIYGSSCLCILRTVFYVYVHNMYIIIDYKYVCLNFRTQIILYAHTQTFV